MKFSQIKKGMKVYDRWWFWKVGTVKSKYKDVCYISFANGTEKYDKEHTQFLEECK